MLKAYVKHGQDSTHPLQKVLNVLNNPESTDKDLVCALEECHSGFTMGNTLKKSIDSFKNLFLKTTYSHESSSSLNIRKKDTQSTMTDSPDQNRASSEATPSRRK